MKQRNTINLVGGTLTLAMTLAVASVHQAAWSDDMTQNISADAAVDARGADAIALQAIFMDVQGKVRWRTNESAPWTDAKVNDLLDAGAEIRTGLKSRSTLRVGKNATILVDAGTTFKLPEMVQDGQTLRTLATVKSGRADFKVDHVGFANDFKVITPQIALAVRGTGFALASGPLKGVDVAGANTNTINAIEVNYIASNLPYFVSGQGKTSSETGKQDPVQNAWMSTVGPPPIAGTMVSQSDVQQQVAQGMAGANPSSNIQQIQQTQAGEDNENAIDTALVLSSETGDGGSENTSGYLVFQEKAEASERRISLFNQDAQDNRRRSNLELRTFNTNFQDYENGTWASSLMALSDLWDGVGPVFQGNQNQYSLSSGNGALLGAQARLEGIRDQLQIDLAASNEKLSLISFDSSAYFKDDNDPDVDVITEVALQDGALLNGDQDGLWALREAAQSQMADAEALNDSVQAAFDLVKESHGKLVIAKTALDELNTFSAYSRGHTEELNQEFTKIEGFLKGLEELIGSSTSSQSQSAYKKLASVVSTATANVVLGLSAAQTARDNYNSASSRGNQALFLAQERKYIEAVGIHLESIAYLTKARKNDDGSPAADGPDGIRQLAEQIVDNFNSANDRFDYGVFADFARPHVLEAGVNSSAITALAALSTDSFDSATELLTQINGDQNVQNSVNGLTQQVNLMASNYGLENLKAKSSPSTLREFHSQSVADVNSSNIFKNHFDQLFTGGEQQAALDTDLNGLRDLNALYTGNNSIQKKAEVVYHQIEVHHANAISHNDAFTGLIGDYTAKMAEANSFAQQARGSYDNHFSDNMAGANQYLSDFKAIIGNNTTAVALDALAAVTQLVNEHNAYVNSANSAVVAAENAVATAGSRADRVYFNAVATQLTRATNIRSLADLAILEVATNGSTIQSNYNSAQADYDSLGGGGNNN